MRVKYLIPFLVLVLIFGFGLFTSCKAEEIVEPIELMKKEIIVEEKKDIEESREKVEEVTKEPLEEGKDLSKEEFFESIKDYMIITKAVDYSLINLEICTDRIDTESKTLLLTDDEVASRYLELASQIREDSLGLIFLKGNNEEEENIIELMKLWFDKMEKSYEYLAKYYWGDGAIYEIKSDELEEEADKIKDECNKATEKYYMEEK